MSDTKNRRTARRLFVHPASLTTLEELIAALRTEADAYGGTIGEVLLAVATRIETGAK